LGRLGEAGLVVEHLASLRPKRSPTWRPKRIVPDPLNRAVHDAVAQAVMRAAIDSGACEA
jgi:malic enzyme